MKIEKLVMAVLMLVLSASVLSSCSKTTTTTTSSNANAYYINLTATQRDIPADGTSTAGLTATIKTLSGTNITDGTKVHFKTTNGTFIISGNAVGQITDVTTAGGQASLNLQSTATINQARITASVGSLNTYTLVGFTANTSNGGGTQPPPPSGTTTTSTTFVASNLTVTATEIRVTPFVPHITTLTLVASDAAGNPVSNGTMATFTIDNNPGGGSQFISPSGNPLGTSFQTAINGNTASIIFSSGTHSGVALVTAAYTLSGQTFTNSAWIVIDGGPVAGGVHFGMAVKSGEGNVPGLVFYGLTSLISVYLTDRYSNPVPDGTPVYFSSRGGLIDPVAYTKNGQATTTLYSSVLPQLRLVSWPMTDSTKTPFVNVFNTPKNGENEVIAYTYGEEWFNDVNQNGVHDSGESVIHQGDPWIDANLDRFYDPYSLWYFITNGTACTGGCFTNTTTGSYPIDIRGASLSGIVSSKTDNEWYWPRYAGASYSPPALDTGNTEWFSHTAVWNSIIVVFSGSPVIWFTPTFASIPTGTSTIFTVYFGDENGNILAPGSTISASFQGAGAQATVIPSSYDAGKQNIGVFKISTPATPLTNNTPVEGLLELSLTSPNLGSGTMKVGIPITVVP